MAGLNWPIKLKPETRGQFAAIAQLRWQLFFNSLRTIRGRLELVSRIAIGLAFTLGGLGAGFGLGMAAWYFSSQDRLVWLAFLLWPIFLFWQTFPLMAAAFTENVESSNLLRFPLSYRSYFLVRLAYGSLDPSTTMAILWLLGIVAGIGVAKPRLLPWAALVLLAFALENILLTRMIFAWIERWLAQRRTREILGVVFFLVMISFQLVGPLAGRLGKRSKPELQALARAISSVQRALPPGLSARALAAMGHGRPLSGLRALGLSCLYGVAFVCLLDLRLRAQYRGESLSESARSTAAQKPKGRLQPGWGVPGFSSPLATVFEKELRYFSRSGPMLLTMIMPLFMLLVFRVGPAGAGRGGSFLMRAPELAFPIGAAYALLMLTNLVYNNFGAEGSGIQFFFASPVRFQQIVVAKNLAHMAVFSVEAMLVWLAVFVMYRPPALDVTMATLAGILFAAPVNLTAGNLLSIYSPKKIEYGTFGRQRASQVTVLASFGIQFAVFGLGALTLFLSRRYGSVWLATAVFLVLAGPAFVAYVIVLSRIDGIVLRRRETLISELSRA